MPLSHVSPPSRKRSRRRLSTSKNSVDEGDNIGQDNDEDWIAAQDALKLVRDAAVNTRAPLEVEQLVWQRISGYVQFQSDIVALNPISTLHKVSGCH